MELRQLQYFVKVARMQHVTQAAEELHIFSTAVSRQIHQLEEELGVSLFIQQGRNLQLTPVGKLFLERIEVILSDIDRAITEVHDFFDPEYGEIRIGFPHSLGALLVPDIVSKFRKEHPNVRFKFRQGVYTGLLREVVKCELDLAFISPFPANDELVTGEMLMHEELFAILPSTHRLAGQESIRLEQLKDDPFVLFNEGYSLRTLVWESCRKAGFTPKIAFEGEETVYDPRPGRCRDGSQLVARASVAGDDAFAAGEAEGDRAACYASDRLNLSQGCQIAKGSRSISKFLTGIFSRL